MSFSITTKNNTLLRKQSLTRHYQYQGRVVELARRLAGTNTARKLAGYYFLGFKIIAAAFLKMSKPIQRNTSKYVCI
jgi:hypothetical protein